jgi:hypothetical protein
VLDIFPACGDLNFFDSRKSLLINTRGKQLRNTRSLLWCNVSMHRG